MGLYTLPQLTKGRSPEDMYVPGMYRAAGTENEEKRIIMKELRQAVYHLIKISISSLNYRGH